MVETGWLRVVLVAQENTRERAYENWRKTSTSGVATSLAVTVTTDSSLRTSFLAGRRPDIFRSELRIVAPKRWQKTGGYEDV